MNVFESGVFYARKVSQNRPLEQNLNVLQASAEVQAGLSRFFI